MTWMMIKSWRWCAASTRTWDCRIGSVCGRASRRRHRRAAPPRCPCASRWRGACPRSCSRTQSPWTVGACCSPLRARPVRPRARCCPRARCGPRWAFAARWARQSLGKWPHTWGRGRRSTRACAECPRAAHKSSPVSHRSSSSTFIHPKFNNTFVYNPLISHVFPPTQN